jgi:cell division protein ZapA
MSNVTLHIGGRQFTVACAEGEEGHVTELGRMIDARLSAMGEVTSQSEPRMLLFAALLLADDLHEAQSSRPAQPAQPAQASAPAPAAAPEIAGSLERIANRLENLADRLESGAASA